MSETDNLAVSAGDIDLDPFAYQPGRASGIQGLGGDTRHEDPGYAFHTDYVPVGEGPGHFTVRFFGLGAKLGTLQLRVHMLIDAETNPRLMLGNSTRTQFNRLIQLGGETSIHFDGYKNVRYALYGNILGESDARADMMTVTLNRPGLSEDGDDRAIELRNTEYGRAKTKAVPLLLSPEKPVLLQPFSQAASRGQAKEPVYREWSEQLARAPSPDRATWAAAYVLQSLKAYGMLESGAAGLGFGAEAEAVGSVLGRMGIDAAMGAMPEGPDALPGQFANCDFLWTIDDVVRRDANETFLMIEGLMRCLRPGGLAVHVLPFLPGRAQRGGEDVPGAVQRKDVERIALMMIARYIETAQVKFECDDPLLDSIPGVSERVGAFGFVFRKPEVADA